MLDNKEILNNLEKIISKEKIKQNEPMKEHTSLKIGGPAEIFVRVSSVEELKEILKLCKTNKIPLTIVGNGSNILVLDKGIKGIVIKTNLKEIKIKNKENENIEIHTYGIENESEVMAEDIILNENDSEFVCNLKGEKFKVKVLVGGIHFVYNALCAATVGKNLGLNIKQIKQGIETFELTKKRMDITELENGVTIINDSYNASFESMQASLKYLHGLKNNRKIAVLGDMFELGEYSKELHEKVGMEVVKNNIDILICSGKNAKYIAEAAKENGMNEKQIYYFEEKEQIQEFIKQNWKNGDAILFKASNGMKFFEIVENILK